MSQPCAEYIWICAAGVLVSREPPFTRSDLNSCDALLWADRGGLRRNFICPSSLGPVTARTCKLTSYFPIGIPAFCAIGPFPMLHSSSSQPQCSSSWQRAGKTYSFKQARSPSLRPPARSMSWTATVRGCAWWCDPWLSPRWLWRASPSPATTSRSSRVCRPATRRGIGGWRLV